MKNLVSYLITLKSKNNYLYSRAELNFYLIHPLLKIFLEMYFNNLDIEKWIMECKYPINIGNSANFNKIDVMSYYRKFLFFKEHIIKDYNYSYNVQYSPESIEFNLANTHNIVFEVTEKCNLNCHYCTFGKLYTRGIQRKQTELDFQKAKALIDYLVEYFNSSLNCSFGNQIAIGFYGGEPLLNFALIKDIVEYTKTKKLKNNYFVFGMTTNGTLLKKHFAFLYKNDFRLNVSLDGDEKSNCYRIFKNGIPSFNLVIRNIEDIFYNYGDYFSRNVNFSSVYHDKNNLKEIMDFFQSKFNKIPIISPLSVYGVKKSKIEDYLRLSKFGNNTNDFDSKNPRNFEYSPDIEGALKFLRAHTSGIETNYKNLLSFYETSHFTPSGACFPFSRKIFLSAKGRILPCERIDHIYSLGNVKKNMIDINFNEIANKYNQYFNKLKKYCFNCHAFSGCSNCMFHMPYEKGEFECNTFRSHVNEINYLSSIISDIESSPKILKQLESFRVV